MRKKILNEREKQLRGSAAQWERRSAGKAERDGRQTGASVAVGGEKERAVGRKKAVLPVDRTKEAPNRTSLPKRKLTLRERRQTEAVDPGKGTVPGPVKQSSMSPSAEKAVQEQPLESGKKLYREHVLPYVASQQQNSLARELASGGKLPEGYRWHRTGDKAYAAKNLVSKPLAEATAAGQPAVFGINPSEYVKHMQAIDAYHAATGSKNPKKLAARRDAALSALGEEATQYAGQKPADYYRSYENQGENAEAAKAYMKSYEMPALHIKGTDAARHAETMYRLQLSEDHGTLNPADFFETGDTQLLQKMTEEEKNTYLAIASRHGAGAATDYWDTLKKSGGYGQSAYALRDAAYRDFARERPVLSSAVSVGTAPLGLAGTAYSFGQKILGKEIDPYADPFLFGQATATIRDQVGTEITHRYGNTDGTDNLRSWLMRMGYNAAMSGADSLLASKLGGAVFAGHQKGAALAASLMQGTSGAGSLIQDIKLRGGTDEQALTMGGLSILFETSTEYLPMEQLLKTADLKDAASFRQLAVSAFKGGLAEAPGEGLSELLGGISDQLIMGELSNYEQKWRDYRAGGLSEAAAKQQAVRDILWGVCEASVTGFLSGEGSNLVAGAGGYLHSLGNRQSAGPQAAPGADGMPWMDMPGLPGMPEGMVMPEAEAGMPERMVLSEAEAGAPVEMMMSEAEAGVPVEMMMPEAEAGAPEGMIASETEAGVPEGMVVPEAEAGAPEGMVASETEAGVPEGMVLPKTEAGVPVGPMPSEAEVGVPEGMVLPEQATDPSAPPVQTEADGVKGNPAALHDGQRPGQTEEDAMPNRILPGQQEQLTDGTTAMETDGQLTHGTTAVEPDGQLTDGQMPTQYSHRRTLSETREAAGRSFRERAKPLADQTRDLWQQIRRIEDPVTRTLKEAAYMQLFRPMWEEAVNEQFYRDYPHLRPDPEAERRKVQERLQKVPPVILQAAYEMVREQERGPLMLPGGEWGRNGANRQVPEMRKQNKETGEALAVQPNRLTDVSKTNHSVHMPVPQDSTPIPKEQLITAELLQLNGQNPLEKPEQIDIINREQNVVINSISSGAVSTVINTHKQARHIRSDPAYIPGRSYLYGDMIQAQQLVNELSGTGKPLLDRNGKWLHKERIEASRIIGIHIDPITGIETETSKLMIIYSKTGTHLVPRKENKQ